MKICFYVARHSSDQGYCLIISFLLPTMQSYFQYKRIYKQLEKQIVTKYEKPDDVWTSEGRYSYTGGEIESHPQEAASEEAARRASEHGHRTTMTGPAFLPRHSARQHLERDGDVERADYDPEIQADPYTINTRETLGDRTNLMLTGVERAGGEYGEKRIVVTYEGDTDPMDPHNWTFWTRVGCTVVVSLMAFTILWSSTIDSTVNPATRKEFNTSYAVQSVPTGESCIERDHCACVTHDSSQPCSWSALGSAV